jgi:glycosyltransferase involved in cell wall biosynthesis
VPPKVIHVIDNLEPGGAQHIVVALTRNSSETLVCTLHAKGAQGELIHHFQNVEVLTRTKLAVLPMLFGLVRRVFKYRSSAIFNAHLDASTLFLCLLRKVIDFRLIVTVHATHGQWPGWFRAIFRRVIFYADHVIVESHRARDETLALGMGEDRLTLIPIGTMRTATDLAAATRDIRTELGIGKETPIFLNVARMVPGKGQIHLVRAMASIPQAVAVIVGFGPEEERLRAEATALRLKDRVLFAGMRTDLENFYPAASAFVMPCLDESMGIVIYDALTFRLPVVAYASGSIGEIVIDGENGYLLEPREDELAKALRRILLKETEFKFRSPEDYSAATMVDRHKALYARLMSSRAGPAGRERDA